MYIKPSDLSTAAPFPSVRPQAAAQGLPLSPQSSPGSVNLALSSAVRALSAALAPLLPDLGSVHVSDLLTQQDRVVLTRAWEFAEASGEDRAQVPRLALDLSVYRAEAEPFAALRPLLLAAAARAGAAEVRAATPAPPAPLALGEPAARAFGAEGAAFEARDAQSPAGLTDAPPVALRLPTFTPRDEQIARAILTRLSPRDAALPHDFVRALLDPDRQPVHAADLGFVRKLIEALSPAGAAPAIAAAPMALRAARETLARAIAALGLALTELPPATPHAASRALQLLRESVVRWMAAASGELGAAPPPEEVAAFARPAPPPAQRLSSPTGRALSGGPPTSAPPGTEPPALEAPVEAPPALAPGLERAPRGVAGRPSLALEPSLPASPKAPNPGDPLAPSPALSALGPAAHAVAPASLRAPLVPPHAAPPASAVPPAQPAQLPDLAQAAAPPTSVPPAAPHARAQLPRAELGTAQPPRAEPGTAEPQRAEPGTAEPPRAGGSPDPIEPSERAEAPARSALGAQSAGAEPLPTKDTRAIASRLLQTPAEVSSRPSSLRQQTREQTSAESPARPTRTTAPPRSLAPERPGSMDADRPARAQPQVRKLVPAPLEALSANDRTLLGVLYLAVARRGSDLRAVDQVALALLSLREAERSAEHGESGPAEPSPTRPTGAPPREPAAREPALRAETLDAPTAREPARPPAHETPSALREHAPSSEAGARPEHDGAPSHDQPLPPRPPETRPPLPAAGYGSSSQLLAKLSDAYRSLAPADRYGPTAQPGLPELALSVSPLTTPGSDTGRERAVAPAFSRPMDVAQSLGVSGLIGQMRREAQRARGARLRLQRGRAVLGVESLRRTACEEEADEPMPDNPQKRRRVRWHLLQKRRKRSRAQDS